MNFPLRGEIWLVNLDPITGHEIGKTRPSVVISNNQNNEYAETITVLPISSQINKIYPFEAVVKKKDSGLEKDSKIKCNQIRTLDKKRLIHCVGKLPNQNFEEVEKALLIHLGMF